MRETRQNYCVVYKLPEGGINALSGLLPYCRPGKLCAPGDQALTEVLTSVAGHVVQTKLTSKLLAAITR